MNTDIIDSEFNKMIHKRAIGNRLKLTHEHVRQLRRHLKKGITISTDKKLRLLQRAGWRMDDRIYTREDLINAVRFCINSSDSARRLGPEYILEKMEAALK